MPDSATRSSARHAVKPRLDELLVQRGYFDDVHAAAAAVLAGEVVVGEHRETSAGRRLDPDAPIRLKGAPSRFASRGGEKLACALSAFPVEVAGRNCVDLGASTGGFTDCLLQHGAARVAAVDVGPAQLDWRLRRDERVSVHERTDLRALDVGRAGGPFDVAAADLSFISLARVVGDVYRMLEPHGAFVALVKPQFELAKGEVGSGGVVHEPAAHVRALSKALAALSRAGLSPQGLAFSPITGRKGNIEFLCWAVRDACSCCVDMADIERVVREAHARLGALR